MLKKSGLALTIIAFTTSMACADISYYAFMSSGLYWLGDTSTGFMAPGGSATLQVNLAPDGNPDNVLAGGGFETVGAADVNLFTMTITEMEPGTPDNPDAARTSIHGGGNEHITQYGWFFAGEFAAATPFTAVGSDGLVDGDAVIYGQIFQDHSIDVGDYYYRGESIAAMVASTDPMDPTPGYDLMIFGSPEDLTGTNPEWGGAINGVNSGQVVPEPGTWALFAMGILTLAGVKLRSRK